jgi:A/G-specific adenine glycosylase
MTAIHRRGQGDIWQGLYEPLLIENGEWTMDNRIAQHHYQLLAKQVKHVLTHRVLYADFYLLEIGERPVLPPDYFWIPEADIDNYAVPRLIEILLDRKKL